MGQKKMWINNGLNFSKCGKIQCFTDSQNSVNPTKDKNKVIIPRHISQLLKRIKEKNIESKQKINDIILIGEQ